MGRVSAISDVRNYVFHLIENSRKVIEECNARNESCDEEQEYLDQLILIEDNLWHMI